jgi:hypothetical protein
LEPDFNPKHFLCPTRHFASRNFDVIWDLNPVDVHAGVIAAFGEHINQHGQRQRILQQLVFGVGVSALESISADWP